ncbi:MAG: type VI secretion system baseplate subunit TssG [Gammaproteobacteria bacterium]|nr:type VI secretion system baseplate subunit TssG [Gammaproteobacteria bacterium]
MSTKIRRKNISVIEHLADRPFDFGFSQAVRLLERSSVFEKTKGESMSNKPVAKYMPPSSEFIRFKANSSFSFPSSDIRTIKKYNIDTDIKQWRMNVNFIGLTGSSGILPFHYTETVLQRLKLKDSSMADFFDIFNHRTTSLFYQASCKYNFPLNYEKKRLYPNGDHVSDNYTQAILSLIGFGTKYLSNRLYTKDESLIFYSGLLTEKIRTASGLQQILQNHFSISVEVKEFIGQWQDLIPDVRTRLSGKHVGFNNCLGKSVMLGRKGWFSQGKIRIVLGPLNKSQLHQFSPGTNTLKALDEIVRLYVGIEHDYDFVMKIKKKDIPKKISLSEKKPLVMGWNTWLASKENNHTDLNETVDIPVSSGRFN